MSRAPSISCSSTRPTSPARRSTSTAAGTSRSDARGVRVRSGIAGATTGTLRRLTRARPRELAASLWAFVYFFALLAGYYVLRPIRDEMAIQVGQRALSELFTWVLVAMLVIAPVFGALTARFPRKRLLPWLYAFFVVDLGAFWGAFSVGNTQS